MTWKITDVRNVVERPQFVQFSVNFRKILGLCAEMEAFREWSEPCFRDLVLAPERVGIYEPKRVYRVYKYTKNACVRRLLEIGRN